MGVGFRIGDDVAVASVARTGRARQLSRASAETGEKITGHQSQWFYWENGGVKELPRVSSHSALASKSARSSHLNGRSGRNRIEYVHGIQGQDGCGS